MASHSNIKYQLSLPSILDDESAYWLGFILADGCLSDRRQNGKGCSLTIKLHEQDENHLYKIKQWLKCDNPITKILPCYSSLAIHSIPLGIWLYQYCITPRKSLTAIVDDRLKNNRHFWRGMVDGDGSLGFDKRDHSPTFQLAGTFEVCESFKRYASTIVDVTKLNVNPNKSIFTFRTQGIKAYHLISHLYQNNDIALDRKRFIAEEFNNGSKY